jgi:predicted mannosyl-3-phosphoglycerate phosphatase (HAD superfamily)
VIGPRVDDRHAVRTLAGGTALAVVLGLDGALRSGVPRGEPAALDRACVRMLDALGASGVQVVIASARSRAEIDRMRERVVGAWWLADGGAWRHATGWTRSAAGDGPVVDWIRRGLPGARVIAIGDHSTELFPTLGPVDLAFAVAAGRAAEEHSLAGPAAVRELLWWIVRARGGSAA